jgi:hypothetical protein
MVPLLAAIPAIGGLLGRIFGNAGKGAADQRITENQQRMQAAQSQNSDMLARLGLQSNNANTRASMQNADNQFRAGLDLNRKQFLQSEPNIQARQALAGSLLSRLQSVDGGAGRNSIINAIGPDAREAGALLAQRESAGRAVHAADGASATPAVGATRKDSRCRWTHWIDGRGLG